MRNPPEIQFPHEAFHWRLAILHVQLRTRLVKRRILPPFLLLYQTLLVLNADVSRIQAFGAGIITAQIALAAKGRSNDVRFTDLVEAEAPHRLVRFDGMSQQVSRAQLGAEAALITRGATDFRDILPFTAFLFDNVVVVRQDNDAAGRLRNQRLVVVFDVTLS